MKRNLLKGIILISAVALSSCSTVNRVSKTKILDDDVYYTKSQAGDSYEPVAQATPIQENYTRNDDYYYYGDYESRIKRFSYFTPFDYDDDFYYDYSPYYAYGSQPVAQTDDYYIEPVYSDLGVYSAYDFGYGYYDGYDNFGYGIAYSTFIYGGGSRANYKRSHSHYNNNKPKAGFVIGNTTAGAFEGNRPNNSSVVNNALTFSRPNSNTNGNNNAPASNGNRPGGNYAVYPGRPGSNAQAVINPIVAPRYVRPENQNPRPVAQQPATERVVNSSPPPSSNNNSSSNSGGGGSSGSSSSSGGGGRPVRP